MNFRSLQRLGQRERRQNRRQPFRQHGFAGAGRADEKDVVAARRRDFQRAFHVLLAFDFGEIVFLAGFVREKFFQIHLRRRDADFAFEKLRGLAEILHRNDIQAGHHGGLGGVFGGNQNPNFPVRLRLERNRQNAFATPHAAGEREFADDDKIVELVGFDLFAGGEHSDRNRQVEARPFFFHVRRREVDGGLAHRKFVAGVGERGGDAVLGFLDCRVGQADERDERLAVAAVDLDFHHVGVNAVDGGGAGAG